MEWLIWTPLELAANVMTAVCIFLAGRNNVHTWWTGIVACVLFGALFYGANLYADVTLQAFFIVTSAIGWRNWVKKTNDVETPVSYANKHQVVLMIVISIIAALGYGWLLHTFTNAYAPWIDSIVLTFSIIAQLLLMTRKVQNWPLWVLVNTLSVPLYWSRGLYMTSILYAVFLVNALWSWKTWVKLSKDQK